MAVSDAAMEPNSKNMYAVDAKRNEHNEFLTHQVDPVTGRSWQLPIVASPIPCGLWPSVTSIVLRKIPKWFGCMTDTCLLPWIP